MKIARKFIFTIVALTAIAACKRDQDTGPDMGYNYFPDQPGRFVVYDVDSFYYNDFTSTIDTFKFQIKEKIQSTYNDNQGRPTLRIERYIKYYNDTLAYSAMPWTIKDVWAANRTARTAEKVEENVRFIKLAFPVKEEQQWNGNAQNVNGSMTYKYQYFDQPRTISGVAFDSVLQVNQQNYETLISKQLYTEKYARKIGMVQKQTIDVESQPNPLWSDITIFPFGSDSLTAFYAKPIMQRVTSGVQCNYNYNSSGTE